MPKTQKKIVLFNPNPRGYKGEEDSYAIPPFSLLAIASTLDKEGYKIKIIDQTTDKDYKEKIKESVRDALCFGVTSMTGHQILNGIEASRIAKKYNPKLQVIWGGYHPSILPEETVTEDYIDAVVRGQGEITFLELVKRLERNLSLEGVKGVVYKRNGRIISTPDRPISDINIFPMTPFHLIDIDKYINKGFTDRMMGYRTSQGCTYNCAFCAELSVTKRKWSGFTAERVINELSSLSKEHHIDGLLIYDSNFFINPERVRKILQGILDHKLNIKIGFLNGRVDQLLGLDDKFFDLLNKVECHDLLIGAESGSQEILDLINKRIKVEDILALKERLKKYSLTPSFSFMFGFPRSDNLRISLKEEFNSLIRIIKHINLIDDNNHLRIWIYTPYPGTPLFDSAKQRMSVPKTLKDWGEFNLTHANVPWVPKKYERKINLLNGFIFPYTSRNFSINWKDRNKNILLRLTHYALHLSASFRLRYNFFALPVELRLRRYFIRRRLR